MKRRNEGKEKKGRWKIDELSMGVVVGLRGVRNYKVFTKLLLPIGKDFSAIHDTLLELPQVELIPGRPVVHSRYYYKGDNQYLY